MDEFFLKSMGKPPALNLVLALPFQLSFFYCVR
uniref:Uncharacterized protein n=1 Tax=Rhizophora mucronata TaxID=61149 RepID=A0A2P2J1H0_RHIMU